MTYNVFGGTLNPAQPTLHDELYWLYTAIFTVRFLSTSPTISSQPLMLFLGFVCVLQTDTSSSYLAVHLAHTAIGRF